MKTATADHGAIVHYAGQRGLSPALKEGVPAFASGHDRSAERCGWEPFFAAMERHGLALAFDPEDPASAAFVPRRSARALLAGHGSPGALGRWARFLRALCRREA